MDVKKTVLFAQGNGDLENKDRLKVCNRNELNLARGYNSDDGALYFNYSGCLKPVDIVHFRDGTGGSNSCRIAVSDVLVNGISVKSKLGI